LSDLTRDRSILLDKLVSDCITYGLSVDESLEYIKRQFGEIKERTFFRRKRKVKSDKSNMEWFSYFTRIGFVELHRKQMDILEMIQDDSLRRLYDEKLKPVEQRDDYLILKLKKEIRENGNELSEFSLGTPTIAGVHARLDRFQNVKGDSASGFDFSYYYKKSLH
jgi:hypothetical protein